MPKPMKFAHAVLQTFNVEGLVKWYCDLLDARVVFQKGSAIAFITYDEEHHRLGFAGLQGAPFAKDPRAPGLAHLAFTYTDVFDLLKQYEHLRDRGVSPVFNVNHGPTLSFYYMDPDGNSVELQVDRFATADESQKFIDDNFDYNPIGIDADADKLVDMMHAGASAEELLRYDHSKPIANPTFTSFDTEGMLV